MKRVMSAAIGIGFLALAAHAQSSTTSDSVSDRTPLSNVRAANLAKRAPGSWIRAALDRHSGASTNSSSTNASSSSATTNSTSSTSSSTGLGGLDSLLGLLGGSSGSTGSTSGLGSLLSLLGGSSGLLGGSAKSINDATGNSAATTGKSATSQTQGTSFLDILQQFAANSGSSSAAKTDSRSQTTTTTDDRKFWKRWADAMLQTTFLGISQAMQSQAFINNVKDILRPFFTSPSADTTTDGTNNTGGTGDGTGGTGGSGQI